MPARVNAFQQPIGPEVPGWTARPRPPATPLSGRYCRLEPLSAERHAADLYQAFSRAPDDSDWTYMSVGPSPTRPPTGRSPKRSRTAPIPCTTPSSTCNRAAPSARWR